MADIIKSYNDVVRRNVDQNDGTWAEKIASEPLGIPSVARQLPAGATSANTELTSTCRRISIHATGASIRYAVGNTSQTATGTSHYLAEGERVDLRLTSTPNIAVIRAGAIDAVVELSELA